MVVTQNDTVLCDTRFEVTEPQSWPNGKGCSVNLSGNAPITISGKLSGDAVSGVFEATFVPVDVGPWTVVLRDQSMEFGARLDAYEEALLALDPDLADGGLKIRHRDIPTEQTLSRAVDSAGSALPPELAAFAARDVGVGDYVFTGPAYQKRWNRPEIWPSMTQQERIDGVPENALPPEGSDLRTWYDRVRVAFLYFGDGHAPMVWDPQAPAGDPSFFVLDEEDRHISPLLYPDGQPVSAQDALLAPLDWSDDSFIMREADAGWISQVIEDSGHDPEDPNVFVFDSTNDRGRLFLSFDQESCVPFFRKVKPHIWYVNQTWWPR